MALGMLSHLDMCDGVVLPEILALQFLPNLKWLALDNAGIKNIDALQDLPLEVLSLRGNPVASLTPLAGTNIQELIISGTKVTDLTAVTTLARLTKLHASDLSVTSFPVWPTSPIKTHDLKNTPVADLCPVYALPALQAAVLPNGGIVKQPELTQRRCP